jgi:3',5'-cyclic AMP phosphodiesterase CpdA
VLHLSDLHLNACGEIRYGVDADLELGAVLDWCASLGELAAVIVTGDVADDGSEAACNRAREVLLDFARTRRAAGRVCAVSEADGVRIVTLDSLVPGKCAGLRRS